MTTADRLPDEEGREEGRIDPAVVSALYQEHGEQLRRFLRGVLGDEQLACDVSQAAFAKMVEQGHASRQESRKAWLFRVAYNEAMAYRRRQAMNNQAMQGLAWIRKAAEETAAEETSDHLLMRSEQADWVRRVIGELSVELQQIVRMRIYEEKTFAVISQELNIPLGTALGRMQSALAKLREKLQRKDES